MPKAPWARGQGLAAALGRWREDPQLAGVFPLQTTIPGRPGRAEPLPESLHPLVRRALEARGVTALWSHQARCLALAQAGRPFLAATPTASGKSLCYNLPVLQKVALEPDARALYVFPTRALAQDQKRALEALLEGSGLPCPVGVYDGDTPSADRRALRDKARVLLTNPDMLHAGILPNHTVWKTFLANLRHVVIDELHTYTGVFGAHLANVLRRLLRAARFHGAEPLVLGASATLGNPEEHGARLLGSSVEAVSEVGAPSGPRHVWVANPPLLDPALGLRASHTRLAVRLAAELVRHRVPTLLFGGSRASVETMLRYLREALAPDGVPEESLQAYRAGYLRGTRRRIEEALRQGEVRCVVATSALELGVDLGDLEAVVCAGYPGTLAETWQRFGRAGRRGRESLGLLVASAAPVDQYLARAPEYLLGGALERARSDPDHVEVLLQHLGCAASEVPFRDGEGYATVSPEDTREALEYLSREGSVVERRGRWYWVAGGSASQAVSLRAAGAERVVITEDARGVTLAEVDLASAALVVHPGAIYQHEGATWRVLSLDLGARVAKVEPAEVDWFTEAISEVELVVTEAVEEARLPAGAGCGHGDVTVTTQVTGFRRLRFHTHEQLGREALELPPREVDTTALWVALPEALVSALGEALELPPGSTPRARRARVLEGLRGYGRALSVVACLAYMCADRDLRCTLGDRSGSELPMKEGAVGEDPAVFLYESTPVGLCERAFEERGALLGRVLELLLGCPCADGCPACTGPGELPGRKALAVALARALAGP
ncbi:MAG: DEAD/DEAH box helicase [Deltaproteobacteria bacterium]|nr:DEAD/DEAH box helicase [Deltaproteobacteria bacterium]